MPTNPVLETRTIEARIDAFTDPDSLPPATQRIDAPFSGVSLQVSAEDYNDVSELEDGSVLVYDYTTRSVWTVTVQPATAASRYVAYPTPADESDDGSGRHLAETFIQGGVVTFADRMTTKRADVLNDVVGLGDLMAAHIGAHRAQAIADLQTTTPEDPMTTYGRDLHPFNRADASLAVDTLLNWHGAGLPTQLREQVRTLNAALKADIVTVGRAEVPETAPTARLTGPEHYERAQYLLALAESATPYDDTETSYSPRDRELLVAAAHVHADLAETALVADRLLIASGALDGGVQTGPVLNAWAHAVGTLT